MSKDEIKEYQKTISPWVPDSDVTMKDVVVHGLVDECVNIANRAIEKVINNESN